MIKSGKESTEHARAWRAEVFGMTLAAIGLYVALRSEDPVRAVAGVVFVAIGAVVVCVCLWAYLGSRGEVKAAAARPSPVHAQPRI